MNQNGHFPSDLKNGTNAVQEYQDWIDNNCQPHYWKNVRNGDGCDLIQDDFYAQDTEREIVNITLCPSVDRKRKMIESMGGGTVEGSISVIAIDEDGKMSIATSSNGLKYKIAGSVEAEGIPGAGGYINPNYGGCVATGPSDQLIQHSLSMRGVMYMEMGMNVTQAAQKAIIDFIEWCPTYQATVLCLDRNGTPGFGEPQGQGQGINYAYRSSKCEQAVTANQTYPEGTCT